MKAEPLTVRIHGFAWQSRLDGGADPVLAVGAPDGTRRLTLTAGDVADLRRAFGAPDGWTGCRVRLAADGRAVRPIGLPSRPRRSRRTGSDRSRQLTIPETD